MTVEFTELEACVDAVIARVGRDLRIATPLALGKPNHLLNALYRRARSDPSLRLTILTALTLERPKGRSDLERRFLGPFVERVFGSYPDLDYELDRVAGRLPDNVRVIEFYLAPGKYTGNAAVQRDYVSSNYTHAARDVLDRGVNVLAQQVAAGEVDGEARLSLSANPDLTLDIMAGMRSAAARGRPIALVAQTNRELPFMYGDAVVAPDAFDFLLRAPALDYTLFAMPKLAVADAEFVIGLYCSALVKDGGTLQVGIGALGDAIIHALGLRHERNDAYRALLADLGAGDRFAPAVARLGGTEPFAEGLFVASEMLVDGFLDLYRRGVVKRRVYDDVHLQRLLDQGAIGEAVDAGLLDALLDAGAIPPRLTAAAVERLVHLGVLAPGTRWEDGAVVGADGRRFAGDLGDPAARAAIAAHCLGQRLRHGAVMHGAFFLGPPAFYQALRALPEAERRLIQMRSVTRVNQLYGDEEIDRLQRRRARFFNTCMMVTLGGAAVSDGLETGTVISGVGGQYNFVEMAQALADGCSILNLRSTRTARGEVTSNVVWSHGHVTIPRHLRDVYVTEYGVADVRGRTDAEIIEALLNVTDSRFQDDLLARAKAAGKLEPGYRIPEAFRQNTPAAVAARLAPYKQAGLFPPFPLGCDFTDEELALGRALRSLRSKTETKGGLLCAVAGALVRGAPRAETAPLLARMGLDAPRSLEERLYRRLLAAELALTREPGAG